MIKKLEKCASDNKKLQKALDVMEAFLSELQKREIPFHVQEIINEKIDEINAFTGNDKELKKCIERFYVDTLRLIKEQMGIIPHNYYQNRWLSLGMTIFGLPLGVIMSTITGNMVFLALGLPVGLTLGLAIGRWKDKKAEAENKQIQVEEL